MSRIEVVAGIIVDKQERILLAKRASHQHQGDKWEFPGGKVEVGEDACEALSRELKEELSIDVDPQDCQLFQHVSYDYPDKQVSLRFYTIHQFEGIPKGMEGQPLVWVAAQQCADYTLPKANQPVMEALLAAWPRPA
ncbi:MAG TPA: 8-oxo-dGTP diphosphatase MutT [Oceanospirillaceae bacterium]|nr:8-oxo-dGTP diphosphatase MutT [Oceanospirillaceae bacterium]